MKQESLIEAGLTKNESKVYLALLKIGSASASEITRKSGVHRVNVYDVVERLMEKGLISMVTRSNKNYYTASNPEELLKMIENKKEMIKQAIPELLADYKNAPEKQDVHYFKGPDGVITAYYMMLGEHKPICVIGSSGKTRTFLKHRHAQWDKERFALKIPVRMLCYESVRGNNIGGKGDWKIRFLPDKYKNPALIDICGDLVVIILVTDNVQAIVIENKEIANAYMQYFKIMWNIAKE